MKAGKNLNIATNENVTEYGNVSGKWKAVNNSSNNGGSSSYKPPYKYTAPASAVSEPTPGVSVGVGVLTASDLQ